MSPALKSFIAMEISGETLVVQSITVDPIEPPEDDLVGDEDLGGAT